MNLVKNIVRDEYGLNGEIWLPQQNSYVSISCEKAEDLSKHHLKAIEYLQVLDAALLDHMQKALNRACESFKYECGLDEPVIEAESNIWHHVRIFEVRLGKEFIDQDYTHLVLGLSGSWECEHAYEAVIRDFKYLEYLGYYLCYPANRYSKITDIEDNYAI